jgi:hypothetical protein
MMANRKARNEKINYESGGVETNGMSILNV